jgi:hypothetical protein
VCSTSALVSECVVHLLNQCFTCQSSACGVSLAALDKKQKAKCVLNPTGQSFCSLNCAEKKLSGIGRAAKKIAVKGTSSRTAGLKLLTAHSSSSSWTLTERLKVKEDLADNANVVSSAILALGPHAQTAWMRARSGRGAFVFLGRAGAGKSFVMQGLIEEIRSHPTFTNPLSIAITAPHWGAACSMRLKTETFYTYFRVDLLHESIEFYVDRIRKDGQLRQKVLSLKLWVVTEFGAAHPQHMLKMSRIIQRVRGDTSYVLGVDMDPFQMHHPSVDIEVSLST